MNSTTLLELGSWLGPWPSLWLTFALLLCRIGGLLTIGPNFGRAIIPWQARAGIAIVLSLLLTPVVGVTTLSLNWRSAIQAGICEIGLGLLLGLSTWLVIWAVQSAGKLLAQQAGFAVDDDDEFEPLSHWTTTWIALALMLSPAINGPWHLLSILSESVQLWPLGGSHSELWAATTVAGLLHHGTQLALTIAAPMLSILMLGNLGFAILGSATSTSIAGHSANSLRPILALVVLFFSISGWNGALADWMKINWLEQSAKHVAVESSNLDFSSSALTTRQPNERPGAY